MFGWPDPNTGNFNQSEHVLYTCYFIKVISMFKGITDSVFNTSTVPSKMPYKSFRT